MRPTLLMIALGSIGLAGCQSVGSNGAPPVTGSTTPAGAARPPSRLRQPESPRPRFRPALRSAASSAGRSARR